MPWVARSADGSLSSELAVGIRRAVVSGHDGSRLALPYSDWPWSARMATVAAWGK